MDNLFNENIISHLGLEHLDPAKQEETLLRIGKIIYQAIMLRVVDLLNEEDQKEFEKIIDAEGGEGEKGEAMISFLKSKISNLDEIAKEEIAKFKEETMNVMGGLE